MDNLYFQNGTAMVGGREIPFSQREIQNKFRIWIPQSFNEDSNMEYRYTYLSNSSKSPLGIALRFTPVSSGELKEKMILNYFGHTHDCITLTGCKDSQVVYRETENAGSYMSIYSMRFAVDIADGVLFGCFNCSSDFEGDWKEPVLQMLCQIEVFDK